MSSTSLIQIGRQPDEGWQGAALTLRAQRQSLLAANIANADTPQYQALDFDFAEAMRSALKDQKAVMLASTATRHAEANVFTAKLSTLGFARYAQPSQNSLDGNSVDMNRERSAIAQNSILYQLAIASVEDEMAEMKLAFSDPLKDR